MAVYTQVPRKELDGFVSRFDIGQVVSIDPIAEGIENSNYLLKTSAGRYILTLYEARVNPADLPFFVGLMDHLALKGFPCPQPLRDRAGQALHRLAGRPAALVTFLSGSWLRAPGAEHCHAIGRAMAELHLAGLDFPFRRANDLALDAWRNLFTPIGGRADELRPGFSGWIAAELDILGKGWPTRLPTGIIHADLFPDNAFFQDDILSGVIDFYFACTDFLAYDLAVTLNSWCFDWGGSFQPGLAAALVSGYAAVRPLEPEETEALPILARGAALRFLLTRLHDWFLPIDNALTRKKDPREFIPVIEFHRHETLPVSDSTGRG